MRDVKIIKYQKKYDYTYAYGTFPTIELLETRPSKVVKVLLHTQPSRTEELEKVIQLCKKNRVLFEFNNRHIEKISPKENTKVIGIFEKYASEIPLDAGNHIVLVNPSDMGNTGTIIRTMVGFGINQLALIRPAVDIFDPRVVRTSMGSIFKVKFEYFDDFGDYQKKFPAQQLYPFMLGGRYDLTQVKFETPFGLVFGNEGEGLARSFNKIGKSVYIRHSKEIDSLNVSVAASIALYQATKAI
ncbi:TrmH family RNA methyltransferase [Patescibacteria group bacterium]|nr:TrmH family RNA methyltransferase [Patescibacteria group bacterium]